MTQLLLVTAALSAFYAAARLQGGDRPHLWWPVALLGVGCCSWRCSRRPGSRPGRLVAVLRVGQPHPFRRQALEVLAQAQSYWALNSTSATQKSRSEASPHACWTPGHHCPASSTSTFRGGS